MELNEFDINLAPVRAIKGQALADFLVELMLRFKSTQEESWNIFVDGSKSKPGSKTSAIFLSQTGQRIEHAMHFDFAITNNRVECNDPYYLILNST